MDELRRAQDFLHEKILLTRAMQVAVVLDAASGFAIEAPVSSNYNHLGTAFGGSINAAATLAGYCFVWLRVAESCNIVVAQSSIRYLQPIRAAIRARCLMPAPEVIARFAEAMRANGNARLRLDVTVEEQGVAKAKFTGAFVATSSKTSLTA